MKTIPYNTGRVQIGLLVQQAMPTIQGDALRIQTALLSKRTARPLTPLIRAAGRVWGWL